MTVALGIHISETTVAAALATDDSPEATLVLLGDSSPTTAAAVATEEDGAVLIGDAALEATSPVVTDPLARAAWGRTGALTAVITHVVGRAAVTVGSGPLPSRLALTVPDDYAVVERDNIVSAANAAGYTDVVLVPESLAAARGRERDDGLQWALGTALIGTAEVSAPMVTKEELGQLVDTGPVGSTEPPNPTTESTDSSSVFDQNDLASTPDSGQPPVRSVAAPTARSATAAAGSDPRSSGMGNPAPSGSKVGPPPVQPIPERRFSTGSGIVWLGSAVVLLAAVAGFFLFNAVSGGETETENPAVSGEETPDGGPSTTASSSSTSTSTTTPTTTSSTTTTPTSTTAPTTSSTTTTPTTTTPVRVATPGPVTLIETGLQLDTGTLILFDQTEDMVLAAVSSVLGEPDSDTGSTENDFCAGTSARLVRWGSLELVFTGDSDSSRLFTQWFVDGHQEPTGLVTPEGLGESATVGFIEVNFASSFVLVEAFEGDVIGLFAITNPSNGAVLNGTTVGLDPDGVVATLWAGDSCTRVFT